MRLLILLILATSAIAQRVSYENYKVYQVIPSNEEHLKILKMFENTPSIDFWTGVYRSIQPVNIMVPPKLQSNFEAVLTQHQIDYKMVVENVET